MLVNRKFLYAGVFLAAIGGVLVTADITGVDASVLRDALQLWPLAIVAIGLGVVLRRTPYGLAAGLLAVAIPGVVLGGGFALAPRIAGDCGTGGPPSTVSTERGVFDGPARVSVSTGCGSLVVDTAAGNEWSFERSDTAGRSPIITASTRELSIDAVGERWWHRFDDDRDNWHLTLPTSAIDDLSVVVNAGQGRLDLTNAQIGRLELTANAGATTVDLSKARVSTLLGIVRAGMLSYRLPAADMSGSFELSAGGLQLCAPTDLGLRVRQTSDLGGLSVSGEELTDTEWESPNFASATHKADISVDVNLGTVEINPIGGCK